jgi:hypothetical protein
MECRLIVGDIQFGVTQKDCKWETLFKTGIQMVVSGLLGGPFKYYWSDIHLLI